MGQLKKINKIIFINFGGRKEKNYFFVCIFNISLRVFTQISIGRAHWMRNLVPTRHTFDGPRYPKNKKYLKKRDDDVSSPDRNLSKNMGDMLKIQTKK